MTCRTARLAPETLGELPRGVGRPAYDRTRVSDGILHLGLGAFHRAHQAVYTDAALAADPRWGIAGVSLRSPETRDRLAPQRGLYSVLERGARGTRVTVIGAVSRALVLAEDLPEILRTFAAPATRIVTLTVTEKGYCHDPASRTLLAGHPGIAHDGASPDRPVTAIGLLAAGLAARRRAGAGPIAIVSCDNLPANGRTLECLLRQHLERADPPLRARLAGAASFPSTMVDRMVPATSGADLADAAARLGLRDEAAVVCEPFSQWVIEDRFPAGRPAWERAGAAFVDDVAPFETMKLRLLNASHSALAYLGCLAGFTHVADAVARPSFAALALRLMREDAAPTLDLPAGIDVADYTTALLERFANPALRHACAQICMDGSQKLPQRLLATARARLAAGASCDHVALAVAAWMRYATGVGEGGGSIDVVDPLGDRLRRIAHETGHGASALATAYLGVREIFGEDLGQHRAFRAAVAAWLELLYRYGAVATVDRHYGARA